MTRAVRYVFVSLLGAALIYVLIAVHQYTFMDKYAYTSAYNSEQEKEIEHLASTSSQRNHVLEDVNREEREPEVKVSTSTSRTSFTTENEILNWLQQNNPRKMITEAKSRQLQKDIYRQNIKIGGSSNEMLSSDKQKTVNQERINPASNSVVDSSKQKCSHSLFSDDNNIRNCLTRDVIGQISGDLPSQSFRILRGPAVESSPVRRDSFVKVFETRAWGHGWDAQNTGLNVSGMGATISWTQELTSSLHVLINDLRQSYNLTRVRILDVPCGDVAWMSRFLLTRDDIDYTGMDIVPAIIEHHKTSYRHRPWKFLLGDVLEDSGLEDEDDSKYDIIICRTLAQHLYMRDITRLFKRLLSFDARVLVTTSFYREKENLELVNDPIANPGRFRPVNLELPPISLVPPLCIVRDGPGDGVIGGWDHFIGIWRLPLRQVKNCREPFGHKFSGSDKLLYSCTDWLVR